MIAACVNPRCGARTKTTAKVRAATPRATCIACCGDVQYVDETRDLTPEQAALVLEGNGTFSDDPRVVEEWNRILVYLRAEKIVAGDPARGYRAAGLKARARWLSEWRGDA